MTNRKHLKRGSCRARNLLALSLLCMAAVGCTDKNGRIDKASAKDVTIKIFLEPKDYADGALCPHRVSRTNPAVWQNKFVVWQTYLESDHDEIVEDYKFAIYFDPLKGRQLKSSEKGKLQVRIDGESPMAEYKYTIWDRANDNEAPRCKPLDPRFRVH